MKRRILLIAFSVAFVFSTQAADVYYYQSKFASLIDEFKAGFVDKQGFDGMLQSLNELQKELAVETEVNKKEPLLEAMQAVYAYVGEISPNAKSYYLELEQKELAIDLLGVEEIVFNADDYCMPVKEIKLWDSTYTAYIVENELDSMMYVYKFNFSVQQKYSSSSGSVEAGVSKNSARGIFSFFGKEQTVRFTQEKCEKEIQVVIYIEQEFEAPKVEKYPEPDYLSPQQKQALKQRQKAQAQRDKEKAKKQAMRDKEKAKKQQQKDKAAAKKQALKDREAAKKAAIKAREAAKKNK